jgi:hypothetical protein
MEPFSGAVIWKEAKSMDAMEANRLAEEWWFRSGFGSENRHSFTISLETGGRCDIRELLADFALQLPYQEEAAMLPPPTLSRLHEIARHLVSESPYRKALDDHMKMCPGPPLLIFKSCPHCGKDLER